MTAEESQNPTEVNAPTTSLEEQSATVTIDDLAEKLEETTLEETGEAYEGSNTQLESVADDIPTDHTTEVTEQGALEPLDAELTPIKDDEPRPESVTEASIPDREPSPTPLYDDPSDEDDGEGEWITPSNFAVHKSRALDMLPDDGVQGKGKKKTAIIGSGCMTADFAMQNVILQMGLNLVGLEGKRIEKIKSWVLRCHACFKCVDML